MSNRVIYAAIGQFSADNHREIRAALEQFDRALRSGLPIDAAVAVLPIAGQTAAKTAGLLIREFEAQVRDECGAQVTRSQSPLYDIGGESSIALENRDARMYSSEHFALAQKVAEALSQLLESLGATKTTWGCVD